MALLSVKDVYVSYGYIEALHGVSLDIEEGSITALIGANGAGKTTIVNAISGVVKYKGDVSFFGEKLPSSSNRIVKRGIVQVPEGRKIFAGLTVEENLRLGAYCVKGTKELEKDISRQYDIFPRLKERRNQDAGTLSGGEQQMLAIARGLMARPKLLMLDEPSLGLAPLIVNDVFERILKIKEEGTTVLVIEQNANKSLSIADKAYVLENGRIVNSGTGQELLNDPEIASAYLGKRK
ncbi:MAG: ABC transporter ATP-binding protein [Candidatus Ornithospirochaeta sp.]|nr:ABC transporter ATP-binding protein [Sphaerochaetaceae bacterium]MDY5524340.1 ABC transporter ATP-binding protein [Candidatus Ornithospirochaeta sp.]